MANSRLGGISLTAIILFLVYPTLFLFITDPLALGWARKHGFAVMPESIQIRLERVGRQLYFVKFLTLALFLYAWSRICQISLQPTLVQPAISPALARLALTSLGILVVGRILFLNQFSRVKKALLNHSLTRGRSITWAAVFCVGGFVEETWRALSISELTKSGFNTFAALMVTSAAYVFCRLVGIPQRILGLQEDVLWDLAVGVMLGGLFIISHLVWVPITVNVFYNLFGLVFIRWQLQRS
jgi:hypothetical protein